MMTTKLQSLKIGLQATLCAVLLITVSAGASARDLRLASGVPPLHPAHDPLYTDFKELLSEYSDGNLGGRLFGTEITTLGNMRASILSGMVEVGLFLPSYFPADLPNFNLIGDLSMLGGNPQVTAAAMTEYVLTCEDCQAEFGKLGIVYSSTHANPYSLLTTEAVREPADMDGLRIRVATPQHARWVESFGGKAVNMTTGEAFEALSQDVVDGTITSISDLISFNLGDVVSHITLLDMGTFHSMSNHSVKKSVWKGLSEADRKALLSASFVATIRTTNRWLEMIEEAKAVALDKELEMLEPSEGFVKASNDFKSSDFVQAAASAEERFGISNAEEKIRRFQELVEKWEGLMAEAGDDPDAIEALYDKEILNQIDLSKYGQ